MSTPPVPPDPDDLDEDPTGIRALLGSLPDPGPMPDDLVARIQASLTAEQAARRGHDGATGASVVPLSPRRRWRWKQLGVAAAAVAAVAVGLPALAGGGLSGVTALLAGDSSSGSSAGSAASTALSSPALTPPSDGATSPGIAVGERAPGATGPVTLVGTGTAYTAATLVSQVRASRESGTSPGKGVPSGAAGPAESQEGLRACLTTLGVEAWMPVWADVASYEGREAVVAVVSSDTGQQVYAVGPECDRTHPARLAGPVPLP
ncbi:hypothetical protein ACFUC1_11340 [Pedococcus sp. NPDC057267]|uniref:hypothetical protein n=1 Tax=Pedococcus sp. NPDC057267 TaxID=3346077 RepID=UPI003643DF1C